jgi:trimeric autotransporter adhesin
VAGNGVAGYSGDGGLATAAELHYPWRVAVDASGNLYVADTFNYCIRMVTKSTGVITTVAGTGVSGYNGDGGQATSAEISSPYGFPVDASGNLYIADFDNHRIRMVTKSTGVITTVTGTGVSGYNGDGVQATSAEISSPFDVAVDASGNLYLADAWNYRIRMVTKSTGIITTVAGTGVAGYNGDGVQATSAELHYPDGVAVDASGNLYIADTTNLCIRMFSQYQYGTPSALPTLSPSLMPTLSPSVLIVSVLQTTQVFISLTFLYFYLRFALFLEYLLLT